MRPTSEEEEGLRSDTNLKGKPPKEGKEEGTLASLEGSTHKTFQIQAQIGEKHIRVLLEIGSTHNFLS